MISILQKIIIIFLLLLAQDVAAQDQNYLHRRVDLRGLDHLKFDRSKGMFTADAKTIFPQKATFLHMWSIYCKPCMDELPMVKKLVESLNRLGVQSIYVLEDHDLGNVEAVAAKWLQYVIIPNVESYNNVSHHLRASIGSAIQPASILVDSNFTTRKVVLGPVQGHTDAFLNTAKVIIAEADLMSQRLRGEGPEVKAVSAKVAELESRLNEIREANANGRRKEDLAELRQGLATSQTRQLRTEEALAKTASALAGHAKTLQETQKALERVKVGLALLVASLLAIGALSAVLLWQRQLRRNR